MSKLKPVVKSYFEATSIQVDIWEIEIKVEEDGEIIEIQNKQKNTILESFNNDNKKEVNNAKSLKKNFICSFSLGVDARIGYGIKKHKSTNKCKNFFSYFWESCKKKCYRKTMKLNEMIDSFSIINKEELANIMNESIDNLNLSQCENMSARNLLFKTMNKDKTVHFLESELSEKHIFIEENKLNVDLEKHKFDCGKIILKGNPVSLVGQNINIFKKSENLWKQIGDKFGLESYDDKMKENNYKKDQINKIKEDNFFKEIFKNCKQKINDKKLEFFSFDNDWNFSNANSANKLYQGTGPFVINFRDTPVKVINFFLK
jgi:hypothetical protein